MATQAAAHARDANGVNDGARNDAQAEAESAWGSVLVDPRARSLPGLKMAYVLARVPPSGAILEVGSGGGKVLHTIAHHFPAAKLFGCDVKPPQTEPRDYEFRAMRDRIPYDDASFDAVLVVDVLEHVPDPRALLDDVARVLKPTGKLVVFVPVEGEKLSAYEVFRVALGRDLYAETKEHVQAFTHEGLVALLSERFEIRERSYAYHLAGQAMDAAFFAALRLSKLRSFWWKENSLYHGEKAGTKLSSRVMNRLLEAGNAFAWLESKALSGVRPGSAGLLASLTRRPG